MAAVNLIILKATVTTGIQGLEPTSLLLSTGSSLCSPIAVKKNEFRRAVIYSEDNCLHLITTEVKKDCVSGFSPQLNKRDRRDKLWIVFSEQTLVKSSYASDLPPQSDNIFLKLFMRESLAITLDKTESGNRSSDLTQ